MCNTVQSLLSSELLWHLLMRQSIYIHASLPRTGHVLRTCLSLQHVHTAVPVVLWWCAGTARGVQCMMCFTNVPHVAAACSTTTCWALMLLLAGMCAIGNCTMLRAVATGASVFDMPCKCNRTTCSEVRTLKLRSRKALQVVGWAQPWPGQLQPCQCSLRSAWST
jgi:hypothetical protein